MEELLDLESQNESNNRLALFLILLALLLVILLAAVIYFSFFYSSAPETIVVKPQNNVAAQQALRKQMSAASAAGLAKSSEGSSISAGQSEDVEDELIDSPDIEASFAAILSNLSLIYGAQDSPEAQARALKVAQAVAKYIRETAKLADIPALKFPLKLSKLTFQDLRSRDLKEDVSSAWIVARGGKLGRVESSIIFIEGEVEIESADNSIIAAAGGVRLGRSSNNVVLANYFIDVKFDGVNQDLSQRRVSTQEESNKQKLPSLFASGNLLNITRALGSVCNASGTANIGSAEGVVVINPHYVAIPLKSNLTAQYHSKLMHAVKEFERPLGDEMLILCRRQYGALPREAYIEGEKLFWIEPKKELTSAGGLASEKLLGWTPVLEMPETLLLEREGRYAEVQVYNKNGICLSNPKNDEPEFKKNCDNGIATACLKAAELQKIRGKEEDAEKYQRLACDAGNLGACAAVAQGLEEEGKTREARKLTMQVCEGEGSNPYFCTNLRYKMKDGTLADSFKHWKTDCEQKKGSACYNLGAVKEIGEELSEAKGYYDLACKAKYPKGCDDLSKLPEPGSDQANTGASGGAKKLSYIAGDLDPSLETTGGSSESILEKLDQLKSECGPRNRAACTEMARLRSEHSAEIYREVKIRDCRNGKAYACQAINAERRQKEAYKIRQQHYRIEEQIYRERRRDLERKQARFYREQRERERKIREMQNQGRK